MREILFRGKRLKDGAWIEGFYCEFANNKSGEQEHFIQTVKSDGRIDTLYHVDPSTIGQYTGLTDKNGKRIFEGDILRDDDSEENGVVLFFEGEYCVSFDNEFTYGFADIACSCYVNGNIHDNPELLEGGTGNE